ncbi:MULTISPECIES: ammonium transporter [unclassified Pseudonocardia]|uniref:ammonium transporter n=2 Tax=unclassified Pseudonocardia TaxID=2619320 RepID=UPI0004925AB4|nr:MULTISPECIES: ammonium transporter [unclassified Pseudonocardia]ALE76484.1 ammonia channel protein [Pseudonocardia sp. EC080625-04]ALL79160.1 ammonia channel protein [Pseudonocardia sp. EC080610-09]ALL84336.1 ammonia channel protein [Pseudonocardia sp. EC080619-01]
MNGGDTAWILASAALVLLMTPGVALFYGGQARSKSVLNMMMMCFSSLGLVGVLWILFGYSMTFGTDLGGGLLGNPFEAFGLSSVLANDQAENALPDLAFVSFQAMFAILTVALVAGAAADRMKFGAWMLFSGLWATLVYFPIAHWVFDLEQGWIATSLGALDFAGGTAVHINAGVAALVLCIILGKRRGWPREAMRPHNLTMVMLGAGLLWFGWFGFNAGSSGAADWAAAYAFTNTIAATAAAILGWLLIEKIRYGKATSLGAASGIVAGLVAITPACASVSPLGALAIGVIAGALSAYAVGWKYKLGYDDSFDVVGVHLVAGLWGTLAIGLFATDIAPDETNGLFYGGGAGQLGIQAVAALATIVYCGIVTTIIALVVKFTLGLRVEDEAEQTGIDEAEHAETGYEFSGLRGGSGLGSAPKPPAAAPTTPAKQEA